MTKPLRIGLIMQGGRGWIGGSEYIKNIIFALASLPPDVRSTFEICLIIRESLDSRLYAQTVPLLNQLYHLEEELDPFTFLNRLRWKLVKVIFKQVDPRFEAFLQKANLDFIYPYLSENRGKTFYRSAAWIYDFQHKSLPHFFTQQEIEYRNHLFNLIASHAATVVLSSKNAECDFHMFYPQSASQTKILSFRTYPQSSWHEASPLEIQHKYCLPERFFLVSNQFWQHKNHSVVFKALSLLLDKYIYPIVVCTGHIYDFCNPEYSDTFLQAIHQLGIAKQVYLLGLIPRIEQIQLMRRALAVIQPSLFEGWSTVVEDARCLGKPMILSDFPVHLEQNPPNSAFFDRYSPESLAPLLADWWQHLSPGPHPDEEAIARTNSMKEVQAFGYRFLEIARGKS